MSSSVRAGFAVGVVTLIITTCLCLLALTRYGALDFARLGTYFCCDEPNGSTGYDGQFAFYIAAYGASATPLLDGATLRYQRIVYPMTARALAFGRADFTLYTLIGINITAHSVGAGLLAYLIAKKPAWRAKPLQMIIPFGFSLYFGAMIAVRLDLNEPLCIALGLGAVVAYTHQRWRSTVVLLILSTLTKEIGLVFAVGLALYTFFNAPLGWAIYLVLPPAVAFLAWWGVLYITFDTLPTVYPAAQNIRLIPFNGLFAEETPVEFIMLMIWIALPTVILIGMALRRIVVTRALSLSTALVLVSAAWVAFMPDVTWVDPVAAYRVAVPIVVSGLYFASDGKRGGALLFTILWASSFMITLITPGVWT